VRIVFPDAFAFPSVEVWREISQEVGASRKATLLRYTETPLPLRKPMHQERGCGQRYAFTASAEAIDSTTVRVAHIADLSVCGAYLSMTNPFSKGALVVVKIRTDTGFFQCHATVAHSTRGTGMGVTFKDVSPRFLHVLRSWLVQAMRGVVNSKKPLV
jgi:hypothetical protein